MKRIVLPIATKPATMPVPGTSAGAPCVERFSGAMSRSGSHPSRQERCAAPGQA